MQNELLKQANENIKELIELLISKTEKLLDGECVCPKADTEFCRSNECEECRVKYFNSLRESYRRIYLVKLKKPTESEVKYATEEHVKEIVNEMLNEKFKTPSNVCYENYPAYHGEMFVVTSSGLGCPNSNENESNDKTHDQSDKVSQMSNENVERESLTKNYCLECAHQKHCSFKNEFTWCAAFVKEVNK